MVCKSLLLCLFPLGTQLMDDPSALGVTVHCCLLLVVVEEKEKISG